MIRSFFSDGFSQMRKELEMKEFKAMVFGFSLLIGVASALPASADDCSRAISLTIDYGDGMKMMEYADHSGFELNGGAARLTYDSRSKTMIMFDENGAKTSVNFGVTQVSMNPVKTLVSQR